MNNNVQNLEMSTSIYHNGRFGDIINCTSSCVYCKDADTTLKNDGCVWR